MLQLDADLTAEWPLTDLNWCGVTAQTILQYMGFQPVRKFFTGGLTWWHNPCW